VIDPADTAKMDAAWDLMPALLRLSDPPPRDRAAGQPLRDVVADLRTRCGSKAIAVTLMCLFAIVEKGCDDEDLPYLVLAPDRIGDPLHVGLTRVALAYYRADNAPGLHTALTDVLDNLSPQTAADVVHDLLLTVLRLAWDHVPLRVHELIDAWPYASRPVLDSDDQT
jgi:hypothetical protein